MTSYWLTPDAIAYLQQRKVGTQVVAWRGDDDTYLSKLRQIYGLSGDFREIEVTAFPKSGAYVVTVKGAPGTLCLMFMRIQPGKEIRVESLFFPAVARVPGSLVLDVDVQPVIDATEDLLLRRVVVACGDVQ